MNDEEKDDIVKQLAEAARIIARGQTIIMDLKRKYNGRREPKKEEEGGDE